MVTPIRDETAAAGPGPVPETAPKMTPQVTPPQLPVAALHERMGIEILEASAERVVGRMPVEGNTQPAGLLHGGASCVLAEGLGSIAAGILASPDRVALGIDINATHHRAMRTGWVSGVAEPVHVSRSVVTYEIVISDEAGRRVCTARLTCLLRPPPE